MVVGLDLAMIDRQAILDTVGCCWSFCCCGCCWPAPALFVDIWFDIFGAEILRFMILL